MALNELVLQPLKMKDTKFFVQGADLARFARPGPKDPDMWVFEWLDVTKQPKRFSGGAGMASTASGIVPAAVITITGRSSMFRLCARRLRTSIPFRRGR